jgi:hypothetical protein
MSTERAMRALLDLVNADREQKCAAIVGEAMARGRALRASAHAEARARIRAAFAEERERMAVRVAAAEAVAATKRRVELQRRAAEFVAAGWERIPAALEDAWREPASRRAWTDRIGAEARARLPGGSWRITHAPGWPEEERALFSETLAKHSIAPEFIDDPRVRAGLRIASGGNVLDGTLTGLLADRTAIGALLLTELQASGATG